MKKRIFFFSLLALLPMITFAQQSLWDGGPITSPEINPDNSVTFRFLAPDAREVKVSGDWSGEDWIPGTALMTKDDKGLWSYTTGKLPSELYCYSFIADGVQCSDPNNVYSIRDVE